VEIEGNAMALTRRSFFKVSGTGVVAAAIPGSLFADSKNKTIPDFPFIQLSDTHIPDESGIERSKKIIDAINPCKSFQKGVTI
jgi:hypothetical protein